MPRALRGRVILGPLLLAFALLAIPGPAVRAATPTPIVTLPGETYAAIVVDLDGGGSAEIVRIRDAVSGSQLETWRLAGGTWRIAGSLPIFRRALDGVLVPVEPRRDPMALLAVRDRRGVRPLLVASFVASDGRQCCTSGWWYDERGAGGPHLVPAFGLPDAFQQAYLLDTDADGVDELATFEVDQAGTLTTLSLLRQRGDRWDRAGPDVRLPEANWGGVVGESDGVPGDEVVTIADGARAMLRVGTDAGGRMLVEHASTAVLAGADRSFFPSVVSAGRIFGNDVSETMAVRWPRHGSVSVAGSVANSAGGWLAGLGSDGSRLLSVGSDPNDEWGARARLLDADLRPLTGNQTVASPLAAILDFTREGVAAIDLPYPWSGPVAGGLGVGGNAVVLNGHLITTGPGDDLRMRAIAALAGAYPVGTAGDDASWIVLSNSGYPPPREASLRVQPGTRTWLAPTDAILNPRPDDLATVGDPLAVTTLPDGTLAMGDNGFDVVVTAPTDSRIILIVDARLRTDVRAAGRTSTIHVAPQELSGSRTFWAALLVTTPIGTATTATWEAHVLRDPPTLTAAATTEALRFGATVSGSVSRAATVAVDGVPATINRDGTFRVTVAASPWPRDVLVTATDAVGHRTVTALTVIGLVDYRWLPWPLLVVAATTLVGLGLYVLAPRLRREERSLTGTIGAFEELDETSGGPWTATLAGDASPDERPSD